MDSHAIIQELESKHLKKSLPDIRVGETIKVHSKIREGNKERIQIFEGLVIGASGGTSLRASFTVRKVVAGVGIERTFPLHSPWITKVERVKSGKVRRAKLYFVRRHAQSPKRFKLKDKGVAGTIWTQLADQQAEIAQEDNKITQATKKKADEPKAKVEEAVAPTQDSATIQTDEPAQEFGHSRGESSQSASDQKKVSDTQEKS